MFSIVRIFLHLINIFPPSREKKFKKKREVGKTTTLTCSESPRSPCTALAHPVLCLSSQIKPISPWGEGSVPHESEDSLGLHSQPPPWLLNGCTYHPDNKGWTLSCYLVPHTHTLPPQQAPGSQSHLHPHFSSQDPLSRPFPHKAKLCHHSAQ